MLLLIQTSKSLEQDHQVQTQRIQVAKEKIFPKPETSPDFARVPLYFIPNQGQVEEKGLYYAKASRYTLWITKEGLVFDRARKTGPESHGEKGGMRLPRDFSPEKGPQSSTYERDISRVLFLDANKEVELIPVEIAAYRVNYFIGSDYSKWKTDIPTSEAVLYKEIYKGIDLKVYGVENQIEYDWVVTAGEDVEKIRFEYPDAKETWIDESGDLVVKTEFAELKHKKPVGFQVIGDEKVMVEAGFNRINSNTYGFKVGEHDERYDLVIDPIVLGYSTYLGGTGSEGGYGIAVDKSGCAFVTGTTYSPDFPTQNPYQTYYGGMGSGDAFVTKLSAAGNTLVYSTYLGGSNYDHGHGIGVDSSGCAYITGTTGSTNFPTRNPYQTDQPLGDVFVVKLSAAGNTLIYSTYLGGDGYDVARGIAIDSFGQAYLTGATDSTNFPTLNPFQTDQPGRDAFVTKLSASGHDLIYSTYLGGNLDENDGGWMGFQLIAVDNSGCAYVTGTTESTNFPTLNPFQTDQLGWDAFVTKLSSAGNSLVYSTYLGGNGFDQGSGIAVDSSNCAYIAGITTGTDFPTQNPFQTCPSAPYENAFVTKLSSSGNSLVYSTYLGGKFYDGGYGIAVDKTGCAYVTGYADSDNFPTKDPFQTRSGYDDVFVTKFSSTGNSLIYSTFLGGTDNDWGYGIAVDSSGNAYVTGDAGINYPTQNPYQGFQGGAGDAFVTKIMIGTPPSTPTSPSPLDGATGVARNPALTWSSTGATSYDVYGGSKLSLVKIATVNTPSYTPGTLPALTKCYWKIVAKNAYGSTPGPLWSFTTGKVVFHSVSAPTTPSGSSYEDKNLTCTFTTGGSICDQGHGIQYKFDWGDGQYSDWLSIKIGGALFISTSHSWSSYGTYSIRAQARCATDNNVVSGWSFIKSITICESHFLYSGSWTGAEHGTDGWYVGDFNGDYKDDIFQYVPGTSGADVFLSNGTKFISSGSWTGAGYGIDGWYVGDFNGDGRDDIFRYVPGTSGADVFLSNGTKFVSFGSWTGAGHGTDGWYVGDFNGDGKDDIFRYIAGTSGADVFLSSGTKFVYSGSWTGAGHGTDGWYVGDFNGDGKDDIFRYIAGTSGADVFLSNGTKFVSSGSWTGAGHGTDGWYVGDFNGDGKTDIVRYISGVAGAQVFLSNQLAFVNAGIWTNEDHGTDGWYIGDFNGDWRDDIFRYIPGISGAEVLLSQFTPTSSSSPYPAEILLAFDEDMMLDIQGTREMKMSYQEEEEFLRSFIQRIINEDAPTIYELKKAYEEITGESVRKVAINQLLYRHDYWKLEEGLQRTKKEK
jgi:hypothetical protein